MIKIYRKEVIDKYRLSFPEEMFYEDNCAGPVWMLHFKHFEKVEEPLYYYYQDAGSTTHFITESKCRDRMRAGKLLIEQCRQYGFYEQYRQELEFAFTKLYYVNTLFTYVIGVKGQKLSFLEDLKKGILEEFPDFQENSYFQKTYDVEQKKLIRMHMKSSVLFWGYYRALSAYRRIRKKKNEK